MPTTATIPMIHHMIVVPCTRFLIRIAGSSKRDKALATAGAEACLNTAGQPFIKLQIRNTP